MTKKKPKEPARPAAAKKPAAFNSPFAGLKKALNQTAPPPSAPLPKAVALAAPPDEVEPADEVAFVRAMAGVRPLSQEERERVRPLEADHPPVFAPPPDDDLEVMAHLADLVAGVAEFDLRWSPGYIQGRLPGVADDLMEQMRQGAFPIQDHLDLHGMDQEQAAAAVEDFVLRCVARGMRHVLIVHGRGLSSPGGVPVLKQALPGWLAKKRMRRNVLAFCTALAHDGGEGASYILLRRWSGPGRGPTFG